MRIPVVRLASAVLALAVSLAGVEAPAHEHARVVDGWHDATPHGCAHQVEPTSCSICRLAHESSVATAAPLALIDPERIAEHPAPTSGRFAPAVFPNEHSPRAPPTVATLS